MQGGAELHAWQVATGSNATTDSYRDVVTTRRSTDGQSAMQSAL